MTQEAPKFEDGTGLSVDTFAGAAVHALAEAGTPAIEAGASQGNFVENPRITLTSIDNVIQHGSSKISFALNLSEFPADHPLTVTTAMESAGGVYAARIVYQETRAIAPGSTRESKPEISFSRPADYSNPYFTLIVKIEDLTAGKTAEQRVNCHLQDSTAFKIDITERNAEEKRPAA